MTELHVHNAIEFTERRSNIGTLAYREGRRPLGPQIQSTQLLAVDCNTKPKHQLTSATNRSELIGQTVVNEVAMELCYLDDLHPTCPAYPVHF